MGFALVIFVIFSFLFFCPLRDFLHRVHFHLMAPRLILDKQAETVRKVSQMSVILVMAPIITFLIYIEIVRAG